MDTDSFIIHVKNEDFYKDVLDHVEKWFDTSNYSEDDKRPLPTGINKKVIALRKDELGQNIMAEFAALRPKTYSYLVDDGKSDKKDKRTKKCVIKRRLTFNNYTNC